MKIPAREPALPVGTITRSTNLLMNNALDIDVVWGGYYASQSGDDDAFTVFRLLDLDQDGYQAALYREKFDKCPTMADVAHHVPFVGHVPMAIGSLLHERNLKLIGRRPLTDEDLEGYMLFLEHQDVPSEERQALTQKLIGFGDQDPVPLTVEEVDGEVMLSVRE
jgi:hypothetical protein